MNGFECDHFTESAHFFSIMLCGEGLASPDPLTHAVDIDAVISSKTMTQYFDRCRHP